MNVQWEVNRMCHLLISFWGDRPSNQWFHNGQEPIKLLDFLLINKNSKPRWHIPLDHLEKMPWRGNCFTCFFPEKSQLYADMELYFSLSYHKHLGKFNIKIYNFFKLFTLMRKKLEKMQHCIWSEKSQTNIQ
jgi:hypothetical protein